MPRIGNLENVHITYRPIRYAKSRGLLLMMTHGIHRESLINGAILSRILQPGMGRARPGCSGAGTRWCDSVPTFLLESDALLMFSYMLWCGFSAKLTSF